MSPRLTLDELRKIVLQTSVVYVDAILNGQSIQEAERMRMVTLAHTLRHMHLTTWAVELEQQFKIIGGD